MSKNISQDIKSEIRRLGDLLIREELLLDRNYPQIYTGSNNVIFLSWENYSVSEHCEFGSIEQYVQFLRNKQYSFVLFDGALIQIRYSFKNQNIINHSLGYYPPPVPLQRSELAAYISTGRTLLDLIEDKIQGDSLRESLRLRSPIRFDFNTENISDDHPASHLHVSQGSCRIAVFAPVSIGLFLTFLFKSFYSEYWTLKESIRKWPRKRFDTTITQAHKETLHISYKYAT